MLILADPGSTHNGNLHKCFDLIDIGASAGVDGVKFQLIPKGHEGANAKNPIRCEEALRALIEYGEKAGIQVYASIWDRDGYNLLKTCHCPWVKFAYSQRNHHLITEAVSQFNKVFVSGSIMSPGAQEGGVKRLYVETVHSDPCYPVMWQIKGWESIAQRGFVGLSDHSMSTHNALRALASGMDIVECHYQGDWDCPYPDALFAKTPAELERYVGVLRKVAL